MMKLAVFFALLSVSVAVSVRYQGSGGHKHHAPKTSAPPATSDPAPTVPKADINVELAGGASTSASGDQAVGTAADGDSGAVGAKGEDTAFGLAGPNLALGFGQGSGPDATPGLGGIFNIFN